MPLIKRASLVALAFCAAPAMAQEYYGEKGWTGDEGSKSYVAEEAQYIAPAPEVYVQAEVQHAAPYVPYGCVMGLGVMQRGTLICPGH